MIYDVFWHQINCSSVGVWAHFFQLNVKLLPSIWFMIIWQIFITNVRSFDKSEVCASLFLIALSAEQQKYVAVTVKCSRLIGLFSSQTPRHHLTLVTFSTWALLFITRDRNKLCCTFSCQSHSGPADGCGGTFVAPLCVNESSGSGWNACLCGITVIDQHCGQTVVMVTKKSWFSCAVHFFWDEFSWC